MLSNPTAPPPPPPPPQSLHTPVVALRQQETLDAQPANKPYNTRRVSLSLTSLGIHVPGSNSNRANARHRRSLDNPPAKRAKHQHTLSASSATASKSASPPPVKSRSRSSTTASARHPPIVEPTPPPSPGYAQRSKLLDLDGINDDVVVAVLEQLQSTGNRPHLIKELSNILLNTTSSVQSSSNPNAIISSRLTNYLRRPWTALAPCPLTKEQVATHPRRVYYFLTTQPRQAIPESSDAPVPSKRTVTPALSLGADDSSSAEDDSLLSNDAMSIAHSARSLSPDLDLSLPDLAFTHPQSAPDLSFDRAVQAAEAASAVTALALERSARATSPPLSTEEREFTMTASALQLRKQSEEHEKTLALLQLQLQMSATQDTGKGDAMSLDGPAAASVPLLLGEQEVPVTSAGPLRYADAMVDEECESDERAAQQNREAADVLFGHGHRLLHTLAFSSPVLRPQQLLHLAATTTMTPRKAFAAAPSIVGVVETDALGGWTELQSPEDVELAELDHLLGGF